jgi:hypothetical protein
MNWTNGLRPIAIPLTRWLDADADEFAKDLRKRLDRPGLDDHAQPALIMALGMAASRLDATEAARVAEDLRGRLERAPTDVASQPYLVSALGNTIGRLSASDATELANFLRAWLDRPETDGLTEQALLDALAMAAAVRTRDAASVRDLIVSVGLPLRDPSESPAWPILEQISGAHFDRDPVPLVAWAHDRYAVEPTDARPVLHR